MFEKAETIPGCGLNVIGEVANVVEVRGREGNRVDRVQLKRQTSSPALTKEQGQVENEVLEVKEDQEIKTDGGEEREEKGKEVEQEVKVRFSFGMLEGKINWN